MSVLTVAPNSKSTTSILTFEASCSKIWYSYCSPSFSVPVQVSCNRNRCRGAAQTQYGSRLLDVSINTAISFLSTSFGLVRRGTFRYFYVSLQASFPFLSIMVSLSLNFAHHLLYHVDGDICTISCGISARINWALISFGTLNQDQKLERSMAV